MSPQSDNLQDDGLCMPEVGDWSVKKYRLIATYSQIFSTAMKKKWECRVYIDLFAGAGLAKIKDGNRIVVASPLLALQVPDRFDKYIFCDKEEEKLSALRQRAEARYPDVDATYIRGDVNQSTGEILKAVPKASRGYRVLSFCVVDPFSMNNLHFTTIQELAQQIYVDFLVLIPSDMDAHRNQEVYLNPKNNVVETFLGSPEWRGKWSPKSKNFGLFIVQRFGEQMAALGYYDMGVQDTVLVKYSPKNMRLYRLALYSRNKLGVKFWGSARKSSEQQLSLF